MLVRNQVGAIVGALIYVYVLEPMAGGADRPLARDDDIMPTATASGAVGNGLSGHQPGSDTCSASSPPACCCALYMRDLRRSPGCVLMQRRDITA